VIVSLQGIINEHIAYADLSIKVWDFSFTITEENQLTSTMSMNFIPLSTSTLSDEVANADNGDIE
jgi:hypothetical protein